MAQPTMNTMPTYRQGRRVYRPGERGGQSPFGSFCSVLFLVVLLCVPPVLVFMSESGRHDTFTALSEAIGSDIVSLHDPSSKRRSSSFFAHGTSQSIHSTVSDPDMRVSVPGALLLHRRTEYCQWQETRREECRKCTRTVKASDGSRREETYDCDCVTKYDYIKTWRSHRINSMLFDQPAAHHNPQRDPMPAVKIPSTDAELDFDIGSSSAEEHGGKTEVQTLGLDSSILSNGVRSARWRTVNWVLGGVPQANPSFFTRFFGKWLPPDRTRYEPIEELRGIDHSPAAQRDNFIYVGQGGYFFSAYQSDTASSLFKYFMQYVEGTLFDWQFGDLMPSCTAGDVRFRYEVQDPAVVSVLGEVATKGTRTGVPILYPRQMSNGASVGLIHAGELSPDGMIAAADSDSFWSAMLVRALLLIWAAPFSRLMGAFLGKQVNQSSYPVQFASMCGIFFSTLGAVWAVYWGMTVDVAFALFGGVIGLVFVASPRTPESPSSGGLNATWCMIGRWANVPPDWRVEDTYVQRDTVGGARPTKYPEKTAAHREDYCGAGEKKIH